jgi:hypothetical protein
MHGIIFSELEKYAETKYGPGTWDALLKKARLESYIYLPLNEYPDHELVSVIMADCAMTKLPLSCVLEDFGQFLVPSLLQMYGHILKPEWKSIDVIYHTEGTVHAVVRVKNAGAMPPKLATKRLGPDEVQLVYTSPRQMCAMAIGIGTGLGLEILFRKIG